MTSSNPPGWNALHDRALAALSHEWTPWASLKAHGLPFNAFTDLCEWKRAERRAEPVMDGKVQRGEKSFFRKTWTRC